MRSSKAVGRHPVIFLSALFMLVPSASAAQNPAPAPQLLASVEGTVVKAATKDPLQGATIIATPETGPAKKSTSDADGKFALRDLAAGRYELSISRTGYAKLAHGGGPSTISLIAGQRVTGIKLEMAATAAITGKVVDDDGNPVSGKTVSVVAPRYEMGRRILVTTSTSTTGLSARTDAK